MGLFFTFLFRGGSKEYPKSMFWIKKNKKKIKKEKKKKRKKRRIRLCTQILIFTKIGYNGVYIT